MASMKSKNRLSRLGPKYTCNSYSTTIFQKPKLTLVVFEMLRIISNWRYSLDNSNFERVSLKVNFGKNLVGFCFLKNFVSLRICDCFFVKQHRFVLKNVKNLQRE